MLKQTLGDRYRNRTVIRKLSHRPDHWTISLWCHGCPDFKRCGGIAAEFGSYCMDHCCGGQSGCQTPCRNNSSFPEQVKEVGGLDLDNVPRTKPIAHQGLHGIAPLIMHGRRRDRALITPIAVLKLRSIVNFKTGALKYDTRLELMEAMKIDPQARLVITGIEQDLFVEPWWSLGRSRRTPLLAALNSFDIDLVTPPNFSLFCDQPRTSDFIAMKRIGLVQAEFLAAGIPCALHPHIRNETDSDRWTRFVIERPEITSISYEFGTGAAYEEVRNMHIEHLMRLAELAPRPLDLVLKGDQSLIPDLRKAYHRVLYIDSNAFMKTMHRQLALRDGNRDLDWVTIKTQPDEPLDLQMQHNVDEITLAGRQLFDKAA